MKTEKPSEDIEALMQEANISALAVAKNFNITLDYSDASIKQVETILGQLHAHHKKTGEDEGLGGLALFFGAYIGEVVRKKGLGGTWARNHPEAGENSFPFHWRGHVLFLYGWCAKRIFDGSADNVWFKYQCLVLDKLKNYPGQTRQPGGDSATLPPRA